MVVTFDDGFEDNYTYAYPILKKYSCPTTIFICTGFITRDSQLVYDEDFKKLTPLRWQQIMDMKNTVVSFGLHSHSHRPLTKMDLREIEGEIMFSKNLLEERLGEKINIFAYPFGQLSDFNKEIIRLLEKRGFICACSTIWSTSNSSKKLFFLNRVRIDPEDDIETFKLKLKGAYDYIWFIHLVKPYMKVI